MNSRPWLSDSRFAYSMMRVSANLSGSLISNIPQITESAASCRSAVKSDASGDIRHGERDIGVTRWRGWRRDAPTRRIWQLRLGNGAQGRNRTSDTRIFSPLLYQLSYLGGGSGRRLAARGKATGL